jgi:hypothetical protein
LTARNNLHRLSHGINLLFLVYGWLLEVLWNLDSFFKYLIRIFRLFKRALILITYIIRICLLSLRESITACFTYSLALYWSLKWWNTTWIMTTLWWFTNLFKEIRSCLMSFWKGRTSFHLIFTWQGFITLYLYWLLLLLLLELLLLYNLLINSLKTWANLRYFCNWIQISWGHTFLRISSCD